jgi:signal transduction histidine kinase
MWHTAVATVATAGVCTLIAMGIGLLFVGRPMRSLVMKARRVGAGDLTGPLALRQRDEIGELAGEMNSMCDRLAETQDRLTAESQARLATLEQLRHAERLTTVGTLASGIAHELGTPLNVVGGRARMISSGEVTGGEATDSARIIGEQAARMTKIIRQLLDFARRRGPQKAKGDLKTIVAQAITLVEALAEKRGVPILLVGADAPIEVDVDGGQIQQALTNLVMNGIQAMPKGGELTIEIGRTRAKSPPDVGGAEGTWATIAIVDHGDGMSEGVSSRIFEPFFTTKEVGEGTGLGLSVTYGIVREHGGWIAVDSAIGTGSRFTVHLPVA